MQCDVVCRLKGNGGKVTFAAAGLSRSQICSRVKRAESIRISTPSFVPFTFTRLYNTFCANVVCERCDFGLANNSTCFLCIYQVDLEARVYCHQLRTAQPRILILHTRHGGPGSYIGLDAE
jgi:hypothetical protein